MSQVSSSRDSSEQPRRASRPSTSRSNSFSKRGQRAKKVAQQQEQACCSEGGEVVLVCCDSPDCVAGDIPICASDAGDTPDDCAECLQAAETGCSGDCIAEAAAATVKDCPDCVGDHTQDREHVQEGSKVTKLSSPSQVFSADEPIQACDVPGCSALEWDEKAVDELLRCCCNGSDHRHESFATPSYNSAAKHPHINGTGQQHQHQQHPSSTLNTRADVLASSTLPAPQVTGTYAFHAHHHYSAQDQSLGTVSLQSQPSSLPTGTMHHEHTSTASTATQSPYPRSAQSYSPNHPIQPADHASRIYPGTGIAFMSMPASCVTDQHRSQSIPTVAAAQLPLQSIHSATSAQEPSFHCEWASCSAKFPSREELVGHVTVTHLLQAIASATKPTYAPPTPAHSHISSITRLSETRDGSQPLFQTPQNLPPVSSNMCPPPGQYSGNTADQGCRNPFGNFQNQPTDPSFDHTLRCLWDSCEASLPMVSDTNAVLPQTNNYLHLAGSQNHQYTNRVSTTTDMCTSHASVQHLPDQSTASLVRHLLQDHLHLPTDVLGQLNSSMTTGQPHDHSGTCFGEASQVSRSNSIHDCRAPPSTYSTPQSMPPSAAAVQLADSYKPPPTPAKTISDQEYKYEFGLASMPSFEAWTSETPPAQTALQSLPSQWSEDKSIRHSCQWKGCRLSFDTTADLMDHISSEHIGSGKSMYYCEWDSCDRAHEARGFNQRQKVMRHVRTHVGDKPFVCTVCGRAFSETTTMAQHMRTHTNEKPFKCPEPGCGKTFALQSALTIHMRVHTGEKPFQCPHPGCEMAFAESSNLSKHVKTHLPRATTAASETVSIGNRGRKRRYTSASDLGDGAFLDSSAKVLKA